MFECKKCKRESGYEPFYKFEQWGNHEEYMRWLENTEGMCYNCYANDKLNIELAKMLKKAFEEKNYRYLEFKWGIKHDDKRGFYPMSPEEIREKMQKLETNMFKSKNRGFWG